MGSTRFRNPRALSSALASLGTLQPWALGFLNRVDTLVSVSNYYIVIRTTSKPTHPPSLTCSTHILQAKCQDFFSEEECAESGAPHGHRISRQEGSGRLIHITISFLKSHMLSAIFSSTSSKVHEDTQFVLATTRDRRIEKEDLASYVSRKREMFLVEYALGVKRDEIRKLEEIAKVAWGSRWDHGWGNGQGKGRSRCGPGLHVCTFS